MSSKPSTLALLSILSILASSTDSNLIEDCLPKSKSKKPRPRSQIPEPEPDQKNSDWAKWYQKRREENALVKNARDAALLARAEAQHARKPTAKTAKRVESMRRKLGVSVS